MRNTQFSGWARVLVIVSLAIMAGLLVQPVTGEPMTASAAQPHAPLLVYDWPQFNLDSRHSGNNTLERSLGLGNVATLHLLFRVPLPDVADGAPAYLTGVHTASGVRDLVFVTTRSGSIVALDAHTGQQIWAQQHPAGSCRINNGPETCYTTSSPAIDPNRQYVYTYGLDGYVHKHLVGSGAEVTGGGWPELATLKPWDEKGSSALSIATARSGISYLYVTNGGYPGDAGDYQGHVTVISLADGSQHVFNANCSDQPVHFGTPPANPDCSAVQTAIWARAGVIYDSETDRIYMATGNGPFAPASHLWGDTVFALNPNGTGANGNPLGTYTPTKYQELQDLDLDLGSTAPAILPVPASSSVRHLAVQSGKDSKLRLLNLDALSTTGGIGFSAGQVGYAVDVPQGGEVLTQPAVWTNPADGSTWIFIANGNGISALKLTIGSSGIPALQPVWSNGNRGTSPIVANNVLYYAGGTSIEARNPATGQSLWTFMPIGSIHWESPIVANGVLYLTDGNGKLNAFAPAAPIIMTHFLFLPGILR